VYDRIVIQGFADDATEAVYYDEPTKAARRLPKTLWPLIRRKLDALHAATSLEDLRVPPGNRLERLRGDHAGRYIRVNDQYRVTFRFDRGHAWEVRCEDYH
jgi:toxin HigB-1